MIHVVESRPLGGQVNATGVQHLKSSLRISCDYGCASHVQFRIRTGLNFTDNNKVKQLYVSEAMRDQIAEGRLAIVKLGTNYEVVSAEMARKIQQRDVAAGVIVFNEQNKATDVVDDAYAEYQVPDDLIW